MICELTLRSGETRLIIISDELHELPESCRVPAAYLAADGGPSEATASIA